MVDSADDLHNHRAEEPRGAAERPVAALWRFLVHRRDDGSVCVGNVVTAEAENSLPATPVAQLRREDVRQRDERPARPGSRSWAGNTGFRGGKRDYVALALGMFR